MNIIAAFLFQNNESESEKETDLIYEETSREMEVVAEAFVQPPICKIKFSSPKKGAPKQRKRQNKDPRVNEVYVLLQHSITNKVTGDESSVLWQINIANKAALYLVFHILELLCVCCTWALPK